MESLGWLVTMAENRDTESAPPVNSGQIRLPRFTTFKYYKNAAVDTNFMFLHKSGLSSNPSYNGDYVVMFICGRLGLLAFWRPGDVESAGTLLVVVRDGFDLKFLSDEPFDWDNMDESKIDYGTQGFELFEMDLSNGIR
ncbi:hypothetical protein Acr_00g0007210 [Actinidia rufa]|uniref:KIB1-4 beta-propeller domain-containing protein n=1 Tax=Actinidia rufa TaxID=165716 RepID=A0A7J0D8A9_9ERIC|nr:hypothetical protein Acr_00g0007210 [Actinidia rufa]